MLDEKLLDWKLYSKAEDYKSDVYVNVTYIDCITKLVAAIYY